VALASARGGGGVACPVYPAYLHESVLLRGTWYCTSEWEAGGGQGKTLLTAEAGPFIETAVLQGPDTT